MTARTVTAVVLVVLVTLGGLMLVRPGDGAQGSARVGQAAPEITGAPWINSEPLSLEKLRGRVVFVEFWTYG